VVSATEGVQRQKKENREAGIKLEIISKQPAKVTTSLSLKPRWISKGTIELL